MGPTRHLHIFFNIHITINVSPPSILSHVRPQQTIGSRVADKVRVGEEVGGEFYSRDRERACPEDLDLIA